MGLGAPTAGAALEQVTVVQQPTAANGYTAVIRIQDPQRGPGHYSFEVTW